MTDEQAMRQALELANFGKGFVSPNPLVGCVIVKDNTVIGEGYHRGFGHDHAEVDALNNAKESVEGATLYVTLEPCCHHGKTPPCTDRIIKEKIARVVYGAHDPNPQVDGGGAQQLRDAGIEVIAGVLEDECTHSNRYFFKYIQTKKPYVIVKIAQSLDGNIATAYGQSKWITNEESRTVVHRMRSEIDAVVVGETTITKDDPELNVRLVEGRNPKRIVLDSDLSMPLRMKVFMASDRENTIVLCNEKASHSVKAKNLQLSGVQVIGLKEKTTNFLQLDEVLSSLGSLGIASLLVEGGSRLFSSFAQEGLIDELHLFIAPKLLGNGLSAFSGLTVPAVRVAKEFTPAEIHRYENDLHVIAYPQPQEQ